MLAAQRQRHSGSHIAGAARTAIQAMTAHTRRRALTATGPELLLASQRGHQGRDLLDPGSPASS